MSKILLSIKPEYVENILNKTKQYEFRKTKCKRDIDKIIIYATAPISQIVAEVEVIEILEDTPENIWSITKDFAGITKKFFKEYYQNKDIAIAYKLGTVTKYKHPKLLQEIGLKFAPQSFIYL